MAGQAQALPIDVHLSQDELYASLLADVADGLAAAPKVLLPKYFYDERGSALFEQITGLPEYYLTRTERAILEARADQIARTAQAQTLVELGSGSSVKTRLLLDALQRAGRLEGYVPVDVSPSALQQAMRKLQESYPGLRLRGVVADFERHLDRLPAADRRMVAFLGSTIGNLLPADRHGFLVSLRAGLRAGDTLLLGTDLVKSVDRLVAAYDDAAGVTAEFNRNLLHVMNHRLGADFDVTGFDHVALWNDVDERMEMYLQARSAMKVWVGDLDLEVDFETGESMLTETSAKFRREGVERELAAAGFALTDWWTDEAGDFALSLSHPSASSDT